MLLKPSAGAPADIGCFTQPETFWRRPRALVDEPCDSPPGGSVRLVCIPTGRDSYVRHLQNGGRRLRPSAPEGRHGTASLYASASARLSVASTVSGPGHLGGHARLARAASTQGARFSSMMLTPSQRLQPIRQVDAALRALREGALVSGGQRWTPSGVEETAFLFARAAATTRTRLRSRCHEGAIISPPASLNTWRSRGRMPCCLSPATSHWRPVTWRPAFGWTPCAPPATGSSPPRSGASWPGLCGPTAGRPRKFVRCRGPTGPGRVR